MPIDNGATLENIDTEKDLKRIPVALLAFKNKGNTLWVHSYHGATTLRVLFNFKRIQISETPCSSKNVIHIDSDASFCIGPDDPDQFAKKDDITQEDEEELNQVDYQGSVTIRVHHLEFIEGGNELRVLRYDKEILKFLFTGRIQSEVCKNSPFSHADFISKQNFNFCLPDQINS